MGDVSISVKEFYKLSDMLMQGLSTSSGNDILETAGMIYLEANANGEKCHIKVIPCILIWFLILCQMMKVKETEYPDSEKWSQSAG